MPLIPKAPAPPEREQLAIRLDKPLFTQLCEYAAFVEGTKEYVVASALERLFKADREFAAWLRTNRTGAAEPVPQTDRSAAAEPGDTSTPLPPARTTPSAVRSTPSASSRRDSALASSEASK
jgi:hypothetical protein